MDDLQHDEAQQADHYINEVLSLAEQVRENSETGDVSWMVRGFVKSSEFDAYPTAILAVTHNEPDAEIVQAMAPPGAGWRDLRHIAATIAMESDVLRAAELLDACEWAGEDHDVMLFLRIRNNYPNAV